METVARHLENEALARLGNQVEYDEFGRSAFNRYYYAAFLEVREMMRHFDHKWFGSHGSLPDELIGSVKRRFSQAKSRAFKIGDKGLESRCQYAIHHLHELSDLMRKIYGIRVVADYQPETLILISGGSLSLAAVEIGVAKHWASDVRSHAGHIVPVWNEINGI